VVLEFSAGYCFVDCIMLVGTSVNFAGTLPQDSREEQYSGNVEGPG